MSFLSKKAGKGVGICKVTVKQLLSGNVISKTLNSGAKLEEVETETKSATYSYFDEADESFVFLDSETFESIPLPSSVLGERGEYMTEGMDVTLELYKGTCVNMNLRSDIVLEIIGARKNAGREDTTGIYELSNGMKKQGPGYLEVGDKVVINPVSFEIWKRA